MSDSDPASPPHRVSPLEEQIGAVVDVYPTDPRGQEVMAILEEAFADDPPGIRTAKWIDELPATLPPAPPDIAPTLPPEVLFHDLAAANAHWPAFQLRNPKTAAFFIQHNIRPLISEMPGDEGPPMDPTFGIEIGDHWNTFVEQVKKYRQPHLDFSDLRQEADRNALLELSGGALLLADFLRARGGDPGKNFVYRTNLVAEVSRFGDFETSDDASAELRCRRFAEHIGYEMEWPWLDISRERCGIWNIRGLSNDLSKKDYLRLDKWSLNHGLRYQFQQDRDLTLITRLNAYVEVRDYGGMIICCYALSPSGQDLRSNLEVGFGNRFGQELGMEKLKRYFELIESVRATQLPCLLEGNSR